MAQADGTVVIDTLMDTDGISDGSRRIGKSLDDVGKKSTSFGTKLKNAFSTGLKTAAKIGVAAIGTVSTAIVGLGKIGLDYNSQIEDYTVNFSTMLGSAEKGVAKVEELKKMAASTPFGLADLAESTQTLLAFNVASEDSTEIMSMLGDISLGNADKLSRLSMAYGKTNSMGKLTGETLQQMVEAGFNPALIITQETGETMEEFNKRVSDGGVSVDELRKAMVKATSKGGQFNNGMKNASKTMSGLISTLTDNARALVGDVFQPISDAVANDLLPRLIDSVNQLQSAFDTGGLNGLIDAAGSMMGDYIAELTSWLPKVGNVASGLLSSLIDGLKGNADQIAGGAVELVDTFVSFIADSAPKLIDTGFELAISLVNGFSEKAPDLIVKALSGIGFLIGETLSNLPGLLDAGVNLVGGIAEGILLGTPALIVSLSAAILGIDDLADSTDYLRMLYRETAEEASGLSTETLSLVDSALQAAESYNSLKNSINESAGAELAQIDYIQRLYGELRTIADENGRVKQGYESRASFILNELNGALDTEYSMNGNIITQYGEMTASIGAVIEAKKAQILLEAQEETYRTAVQNVADAEKARAAQAIVLKEAQDKLADAEEKLNALMAINSDQMYFQQIAVNKATKEVEKQQAEYNNLSGTLDQYYRDIYKYETASGLIIEGETRKAVENLRSMGDGFVYASDSAGKSAEEQKKILEEQVITTEINAELMKDAYKRGVEGVSAEMVKTAENQAKAAKEEFFKVGGNITVSIGDGAESKKYSLNSDMKKIIDEAVAAGKIRGETAENIGVTMAQGVKRGMNNQLPSLLAAARNIAGKVTAAFKAKLEIHSPSRVFRDEIGVMMAKGLGEGFEMQMPKELQAMNAAINLGAIAPPVMATGTIVPPQSGYSAESRSATTGTLDALSRQIGSLLGSGDKTYQFVAQIDGRTVFNQIISEAQLRRASSGNNPFEL